MDFCLTVTDAPDRQALDVIASRLAEFNAADVGPSGRAALAVLISSSSGAPVEGGLSGYTAWGWLFTQFLFVPEAFRGQGVARRLLETAEAEALRRGCSRAWIDTFNPVALRTYRKAGYAVFGELPDFVDGRTRFFLQKPLTENQ